MFLVGYISCPPTMGLFIPATAEVTAIAITAVRSANFLFISLVLSEVNFLALTSTRVRLEIRILSRLLEQAQSVVGPCTYVWCIESEGGDEGGLKTER